MSNQEGERDLSAAVQELAAALEHRLGDHPAPEELLDFAAGDLPAAERERIEEHLALCRECARTALELAETVAAAPAPAGALLTESELAAEWRRFQAALAPTLPAPPARRPVARRRAIPRTAWALAAGLLLAVIGLTAWNVRLRQEARVLGGPRADVAVVDLVPVAAVERAPSEAETAAVPAWADRLVVILNLAEPVAATEFQIEIVTAEGRTVWSARGIRRSEDGTFAIEVPRRFLPAGVYRIRLSRRRGAAAEPVAEYALRIARQ